MKTPSSKGAMGALVLTCMLVAFFVQAALAQYIPPALQAQQTDDGINVVVQLTNSGCFYTLQGASNFTDWSAIDTIFTGEQLLNWTNSVSYSNSAQFFRVLVSAPNTTVVTAYHGWSNAVVLNNRIVEAVIVPNAGRVMQFRFAGSTNGVFWEDPQMYGRTAAANSYSIGGSAGGSFGGDKAWPSPQSAWASFWPPPVGFDGSTNMITSSNGFVTLVTPMDNSYKIRTTRIVELDFGKPVMRIRTIFDRIAPTSPVSKTNISLGIWINTQVAAAADSRCYIPVPAPSAFANGYTILQNGLPPQFTNNNGLISFARGGGNKLGFDAGAMVLVSSNLSLRVDAPRLPGLTTSDYPDSGCSAEVYTAGQYFELEAMGPLFKLLVGEQKEFVTTYVLFQRTEIDPTQEALKVLSYVP